MAEDTICGDVGRMVQLVTHEQQSSALLILQSIVDEWSRNQTSYNGPGHLMRTCLHQAAVSYQGMEAVHIHMVLFRQLFVEHKLAVSEAVLDLGFSMNDYFELLRDDKLGWLTFLTQIVPSLRLQESSWFLKKLTQFLSTHDVMSQTVADVRLLLFAVSLLLYILLDFVVAESRASDDSSSVEDATSRLSPLDKSQGELSISDQLLGTSLRICLQTLTQLCHRDKLLAIILQDTDLFQQLVERLALSVLVLNPFSTMEDTARLLLGCYTGQVVAFNQMLSQKTHKKTCCVHDGVQWTEVCLQKSKHRLENTNHEDEKHGESVSVSCVQNRSALDIFMDDFLSQGLNCHCDLVKFFCSKFVEKDENFCRQLGHILLDKEDVYVGNYVLSCQKVYSLFIEHLKNAVQGNLALNNIRRNSLELQTYFKEQMLSFKTCDFSLLAMTEVDYILKSSKQLEGRSDLELVTTAVTNKMSGWRGLLELGLRSSDIIGWWRAGFFQLVWDNEATLSTERNVRQVLKVLAQVGAEVQNSSDIEFRVAMYRLFTIMFKRLPTLLQQEIVLSAFVISGPEEHDLDSRGLQFILSKEDILVQLTPLLNKLTSAGVDEMMSHFLLLCLFDADLVIQQALSAATDNKAQVLPVVQVFRQMSRICCHLELKSKQQKLLVCLHEVLSGLVIDDNKADNIIQMFSLLTKTYNLSINIDKHMNITKEMPNMLSQSDIFEHFILPALNHEVSGWAYGASSTERPGADTPESPAALTHNVAGDSCPLLNAEGPTECRDSDETVKFHGQVSRGHVKEEKFETCRLSLDVALRVLSAVLEKVGHLDLHALKPFPLLIVLANMYARNFIVLPEGLLDKRRLLIKQACLKSIILITSAVLTHSRTFSKADFLWLKQQALKSWLCVAVLKPVLNIGCDVELHDVLCAVARQLMLQDKQPISTRAVVMLLQLSLVNDEMLSDLMSVVKQCRLCTSCDQLVLAVGQVMAVSLPSEMYRLLKIIGVFLANLEQPFPTDSILLTTPESPTDTQKHVQMSQLLTDAVLQLSLLELPVTSICHAVTNYQAAIQALLQQESAEFCLLVDMFCHCCSALSAVTGQAAHILQVSAMDLLTKMKPHFLSRNSPQFDDVTAGKVTLQYERGVANIEDYIDCVSEESVRQMLMTQLFNVL